MKDLNHLKAQLNAVTELRAWIAGEIAELEAPVVEKWEPKGGEWWISDCGIIRSIGSARNTRDNGVERETRAQAEAAALRMRTFNRLDAWISEHTAGEPLMQVEFDGNKVAVTRTLPLNRIDELRACLADGRVVL